MRSRDVFRLAREAYDTAISLYADHNTAAEAVWKAIAPYDGYIVNGHPVPYSLTVWRNVRGEDRSLGYIGLAIPGGYKEH